MSSPLVQLGLWSFLPGTLTTLLLSTLEKSGHYHAPPLNTPERVKHHSIAFTCVIGAYLAWSLYGAVKGEPGLEGINWYQLLGVRSDATEDELKKGYRTFARLYHPDRAGVESEAIFITARKAFETLSSPVKRFAYDRFGPDVTAWTNCASQKEFMMRGISQAVGFYIISGGIMALLAFFSKARAGAYWRTTLFLVLLTSEMSIILNPNSSLALRVLGTIFPRKRQYQHVDLLHKVWTTTSLAFSQLAGLWSKPVDERGVEMELLNRVAMLVKANEVEAVRLFHTQIGGLPDALTPQIKAEMEQVLVDTALRSHPAIRPAWDHAVAHPPIISFKHLPTPSPEADSFLERARRVPLPPSPPPSPRLRPLNL